MTPEDKPMMNAAMTTADKHELLRRSVTPGVYKHFKGNIYHVLGVASNTETGELTVVYIPQYGEHKGKLSNRNLAMFLEDVDRPELEYKGPRFALVEKRDFLPPGTIIDKQV